MVIVLGSGDADKPTALKNFRREKELALQLLKKDLYSNKDVLISTILYGQSSVLTVMATEVLSNSILKYAWRNSDNVTGALRKAINVLHDTSLSSGVKRTIVLFTDQAIGGKVIGLLKEIKNSQIKLVVVKVGSRDAVGDDKLDKNKVPVIIDDETSTDVTVDNIHTGTLPGLFFIICCTI